jgi:phosphatidylglycerophosphatase A
MTPSAEPSTQSTAQAAGNAPAPRLALLIATGFGLGYLPKAPGTWGSLLGMFAAASLWFTSANYIRTGVAHRTDSDYIVISRDPVIALHIVATLVAMAVGAWASARVARHLGQHDPQVVVIDEISGQFIAFLPLCFIGIETFVNERLTGNWASGWQYFLAGFILFRGFDIWKPWPVRAAERLPGGWGIMADDWVAGIYAALCLWALRAAGL